jgi:polyisoprenoid-binding protein YceI
MKRIFRSLVLSLAVALIAVPAVAGTWTIDPAHSVLNFKIRHIFSKTGGNFGEWGGTLQFDGADPASLGAEVTVQTVSINTENEDRDQHLRSPDFFNVEEFPALTFVSKKVEQHDGEWHLVGDFTMLGVTKEIAIPFEFHGSGKNPWGQTIAGFSGSVTINRKDFGMVWNKALDAGGAILGEEVVIDLEIEAVEQGDAR